MRIRTPITAQSSVAGTRHGDVHLASGADGAWTYTLDNADADTVCAGGGGDGDRVRFVQRVRPRTIGTRSEVVVTVTGAATLDLRRDWRSDHASGVGDGQDAATTRGVAGG